MSSGFCGAQGRRTHSGKGSGPHSYGCNSMSLAWRFTELGEYAPVVGDCNFLTCFVWCYGTKEECIRGKMRKDCLPIRTMYRQGEDAQRQRLWKTFYASVTSAIKEEYTCQRHWFLDFIIYLCWLNMGWQKCTPRGKWFRGLLYLVRRASWTPDSRISLIFSSHFQQRLSTQLSISWAPVTFIKLPLLWEAGPLIVIVLSIAMLISRWN